MCLTDMEYNGGSEIPSAFAGLPRAWLAAPLSSVRNKDIKKKMNHVVSV